MGQRYELSHVSLDLLIELFIIVLSVAESGIYLRKYWLLLQGILVIEEGQAVREVFKSLLGNGIGVEGEDGIEEREVLHR